MRGAAELLAEVGVPTDGIELTIDGGDPVLPARFPVGARAAAALGACGVAAATLWRDRTGVGQSVSVDVRRAATSLLSFLMQRLDGEPTLRSDAGALPAAESERRFAFHTWTRERTSFLSAGSSARSR